MATATASSFRTRSIGAGTATTAIRRLVLVLWWSNFLQNRHAESFRPWAAPPCALCRGSSKSPYLCNLVVESSSNPLDNDSADPEEEEEESVQHILTSLRGPLGNTRQQQQLQETSPLYAKPKTILILSDTTGLMAKNVVEKTLASQFGGCGDERFFRVKSTDEEEDDDDDEACDNISQSFHPFLKTEEDIALVLKKAQGMNTLVVFTLADPLLREQTARMCELAEFGYVDLLGPMFTGLSILLNQQPLGRSLSDHTTSTQQRKLRSLSDKYFRRIEAVEYTLKCDDGKSPKDWKDADLVLCGVSRTGKTPLSVFLSQTMGWKVANVPLVVDLNPPKQLFDEVDPQRVVCLTLSLNDLIRIRRQRLRKMVTRGSARSTYADPVYLKRDLEHSDQIAKEQGFTVMDVTGRAVEETAGLISALLNQRFPPRE